MNLAKLHSTSRQYQKPAEHMTGFHSAKRLKYKSVGATKNSWIQLGRKQLHLDRLCHSISNGLNTCCMG